MIQMILNRICTTLTTVRKTSETHPFTGLRSPLLRQYHYHSRGLVSHHFDGSRPDPVSLLTSVGNCDNGIFCSKYNSTLINGLGRYVDGPAVPLAVVNVISGARSVLYFI